MTEELILNVFKEGEYIFARERYVFQKIDRAYAMLYIALFVLAYTLVAIDLGTSGRFSLHILWVSVFLLLFVAALGIEKDCRLRLAKKFILADELHKSGLWLFAMPEYLADYIYTNYKLEYRIYQ